MSTATRCGKCSASTAVVRQAPACVVAAESAKALLSKKVMACGEARSSGARSTMRRVSIGAGGGVTPVKAAISASVRPCACRKNTGSLMPTMPCRQASSTSELCAAAEAEELGSVVRLFGHRVSEVEAQRTERRIQDQTHTDRCSYRTIV